MKLRKVTVYEATERSKCPREKYEELHQKQRAVIEFLVAEGETPVNIHRRLKNVFEDNTLDYSNVCRWVRRLKDEKV
uniref:Mos1 transposase HTH domain-containing protein n=1 Tax=Octopus bimaculoides TaxID=37653 RepID=A0A0L8HW53_OCTBM